MRQAAQDARHPLSEDERAALVRRLEASAAAAFERQAAQLAGRAARTGLMKAGGLVAALVLLALGGGLAGGYVWGRQSMTAEAIAAAQAIAPAFRDGVGGARWLADVVTHNSPASMQADCAAHPIAGENACTVGVWLDARRKTY